MPVFKYEKVDLKKSFGVFRENIINYNIKEINNDEDILMLIEYLKKPKSLLNFKKNPKDLAIYEANSEFNK